jgi:RNA polymerase sigma-70 factor (ECF subfamily)
MTRAQDGDRRAYQALLIDITRLVTEFARNRLRGADGTEDVVQETLFAIHRARHTYDPRRPFGPWMYAITRHRLSDFAAKQRRRRETEILGQAGMEEMCPQPSVAENAGSAGFLRRALAQLSNKQREVIQMLKLEDYSVVEISQRTGLSVSSVKVTAHRGYKKLRKLIVSPSRE